MLTVVGKDPATHMVTDEDFAEEDPLEHEEEDMEEWTDNNDNNVREKGCWFLVLFPPYHIFPRKTFKTHRKTL